MCSAQHAIRLAARPLVTRFCHPLGRGEHTTVGVSQSAVDFFSDSVSSKAADAVVASESASRWSRAGSSVWGLNTLSCKIGPQTSNKYVLSAK
jgi:hypothetical protein